MTKGQSRVRWVVLAVVAGLAACEDATDPGGISGTYQLIEAEGQSLPAIIFDGETEFGHTTATALSGSLTLRGDRYTERLVVELELDGQSLGENTVVVTGDYTVDGQILEFDPDPAESASFTGTLSGGVLTTLEIDPDFGQLELVWSR